MHTESSSPRVTPVDDGCLLREHACCWNKNGGEKRSKIEEREIRESARRGMTNGNEHTYGSR